MQGLGLGVCIMGGELCASWREVAGRRSRLGQCEWLGPAGRSSIRLWRSDAFIDHIPPKRVACAAGGGRGREWGRAWRRTGF